MHYLPMKRIAMPMLVLLCAACLPGCALLNPHLTVPRASTETMVFAGELGDAISEANQLRTAYHDAVGTTSLARNGLALTLIPLSAAGLAVGITSGGGAGTRDALTAIGAGAATLLGLGSIFIDQGRQRVYLAGEIAVTCAVLAVRPALVTDAVFKTQEVQLETLGAALAEAEGSASPGLLQKARTMLASGSLLLARISTSGFVLRQELQVINAKVSEQLLRTEPDVAAVLAVATGMQGQARLIAPGFGGAGVSSQSRGDPAWELRSAMDVVAPWLENATAVERAFAEVPNCSPQGVLGPKLITASDVIDAKRGDTLVLRLHSSGQIPAVTVDGPTGITAAPQIRNGAVVIEAVVAASAGFGDRTLTISAPAGAGASSVIIRVADPSGGSRLNPAPRNTGGSPSPHLPGQAVTH